MASPEVYISRPSTHFPATAVDNAEVLRRVRASFRGTDQQFAVVASAIDRVFRLCKTKVRYIEPDVQPGMVADYAVTAARRCLEANEASLADIDLVISGSIARQYFEPATAMEIAAKLGLTRTHAFDVTAACVGHLEAIQAAVAYLALHDEYRSALVCTSELSGKYLSYDVQSIRDLEMKTAGLTVGNAAACVIVSRRPLARGGVRLKSIGTFTAPDHWQLCQVPTEGTLYSSSTELMRLGRLIPPWVRERLAAVGLRPDDVAYYLFHQPSEAAVRKILAEIGVDPERGVYTHGLYGNTASASVAVTYWQLLRDRLVMPGDKLALGSAAAGYSMVLAIGEWVGPPNQPGTA